MAASMKKTLDNSPYILAQSAVPTILLPAGTWNNTTGQLAVGTALPYLPVGIVKVYLFASGIAQAGLYDATFTGSAAAPVAQIVGNPATVAGAYTPALNTEVTLATVVVMGGSMGPNGAVRKSTKWTINSSATIKTTACYFGAAVFGEQNNLSGAAIAAGFNNIIQNRNDESRQINMRYGQDYANGQAISWQNNGVNTRNDVVIRLAGNLQTATTDYIILEGYMFEILPG